MFDKLNKDIALAMKAGDKVRLEVLRMMKSKILTVNARGDLPEKDITKILQNYGKSVKETIEMALQHNKPETAEQSKKELAIVEEYLPKMLSEEETKTLVQETIAKVGATSIKDMGKVMKEIVAVRTDVDGNIVRRFVGEILK